MNQIYDIDLTHLKELDRLYRMDETTRVEALIKEAQLSEQEIASIKRRSTAIVTQLRNARLNEGGIDAFLFHYDLSSEEGIALMCLAEALLRIPDNQTIDRLIRDKLTSANWKTHAGKSKSLFVNAATWALMLTGKVMSFSPSNYAHKADQVSGVLKRLAAKGGEPIVRQAVHQAMKILGKQFVMGRDIDEAIKRAKPIEKKGYRYSYDMLGEAAYTDNHAKRYYAAYEQAIERIGKQSGSLGPILGPGISVKLSALHPRYEMQQLDTVQKELYPRLLNLAKQAKAVNIGFTIDAEESQVLIPSLVLTKRLLEAEELKDWDGLGLAIQAYQKRATAVIDCLVDYARVNKRKLMLRLVKGAYWDTEIKHSQVEGHTGYPVFTRKASTDISYIACIKRLFNAADVIYPQFATHNANSLSTVLELAEKYGIRDYEFQCLHGMGDALYDDMVGGDDPKPCRIYAPVGTHQDLLAYLVRRLLENGANSSFVNRVANESMPLDKMTRSPLETIHQFKSIPHHNIPLPKQLYDQRENSAGIDLDKPSDFMPILQHIEKNRSFDAPKWKLTGAKERVTNPADNLHELCQMSFASEADLARALQRAEASSRIWQLQPVEMRAHALLETARLYEQNKLELYRALMLEAGKTLDDAVSEVREAIDFCRYYAKIANEQFAIKTMEGPTGEINTLRLCGRGVFVCISPWNFPLAIFTGQVVAALVSGNAVLAKPATQTPIVASLAIELMHKAGIPEDVLHYLPCSGRLFGDVIINDPRVQGVVFTGSTQTAQTIGQTLASRKGAIVPFIAETGGQNAMIVDSSALPEQVVVDVIDSAFKSAGQRCSALRVLYLQADVADKIIEMLIGAMQQLVLGRPDDYKTDIGPVIDSSALDNLSSHAQFIRSKGKVLYQVPANAQCESGTFFTPTLVEIDSINTLHEEVFGPILHVVRYQAGDLLDVVEDINQTGYGLTLGVHSRIEETVSLITHHSRVGNLYVNRNTVGAVVGVQPFGGEGLSGTGPKAGGPHYLIRMTTERTLTLNTTASGGNASLMAQACDVETIE